MLQAVVLALGTAEASVIDGMDITWTTPTIANGVRSGDVFIGAGTATTEVLLSAKKAFDYARQHVVNGNKKSCDWPRSTYMHGLWEYFAATVDANTPDLDARADLAAWGNNLHYEPCGVHPKWTGPCAIAESASGCASNQLAGALFIELYKAGLDLPLPHAEATLQPITDEFDAEIALGNGTEGSWPLIDLTFMGIAPLVRLGAVTGDAKYFEKLWANWKASMLTPRVTPSQTPRGSYGLFNESDNLFMQSDSSLWHHGYWGRGNGWAMLGLVDAIRYGDASVVKGNVADPHRGNYIAVFKLFASRLLELQGGDGLWRSSMLEATAYPVPDTTGSASFTRGLAYGVNAGLLDANTYVPAVEKAWVALSKLALQPSGRVGYCQAAGGFPTNNATLLNVTTTSDFCVGMFLGAAAEVARLTNATTTMSV